MIFVPPGGTVSYPAGGNLDGVPDMVNWALGKLAGANFDDVDALLYGDAHDRIESGTKVLLAALPYGRLARRVPVGGVITGFATNRVGQKHGLLQAIGRAGGGVSPRAMLEAVRSPLKIVPQANGTFRYVGPNAVVVVNARGEVVTTWATSKAGLRWRP